MRCVLWGSLAFAILSAPAAAENQTFACQRDDVMRNVMVSEGTDAAHVCEVRYQRASEGGEPQLLWHAQSNPDFCASQAEALITRLKQAGWSCEAGEATKSADAAEPKSLAVAVGKPTGITAATKAPAIDPALMKLRPTIH